MVLSLIVDKNPLCDPIPYNFNHAQVENEFSILKLFISAL